MTTFLDTREHAQDAQRRALVKLGTAALPPIAAGALSRGGRDGGGRIFPLLVSMCVPTDGVALEHS